MTLPYTWNPMPHLVDVRCPACQTRARFEFAELVRIRRVAEVAYFQRSRDFEYQLMDGGIAGKWHAAVYYHGLRRRSLTSVKNLPVGYGASDWDHSRYWYRSHGRDWGTLSCPVCVRPRKHLLSWPHDAWFQIEVRGAVLWAFHEESLLVLRDYIASEQRAPQRRKRWSWFLLKVPSHFLSAKVRPEAVKKLSRLLSG